MPTEQPHDKDCAPRLLVDLNSMLNAALLGGKDPEGVILIEDGKPITVNSARYGVDRFFERFAGVLEQFDAAPRNVIGVWDGERAKSVRQALLPGYKAPSKSDPVYEQLNLARPTITQMLRDMGAHTVQCETCEADDVLGYLAQRLRTRRNIVVSGDGDLMVLVDENTDVLKLDNTGRGVGDRLNENPFGPFPFKYITLYKALVGDTSDRIPGAKGFGDAAFVKLVAKFGLDGLELMQALITSGRLKELAEDVGEMKELQRIIDSQEQVTLSWRCAKLMPERVNTLRHPLHWKAGFVRLWDELDDAGRVQTLKKHYGTCSLVHAGNYERMKAALAGPLQSAPFVALDIETSVPEESLNWLEQTKSRGAKGVTVDVLGSTLTGMSLTFGSNSQHTVYITVDHRDEGDVRNVSSAQAREIVELIPQSLHTVIQNRAFEFPVLRNEWGSEWMDNGWYGFVPNALDTKIEASYVDENLPLGLKLRAYTHLDYTQDTYAQTTTLRGKLGTLPAGGARKEVYDEQVGLSVLKATAIGASARSEAGVEPAEPVYEKWEVREYQMNELTAAHVFGYGCDDTRVTAALHSWYRIVMELEGTWATYLEVEQLPEYLTSLAFMQGVPVDLGLLSKMEQEDRAALAEAEAVLDTFLIARGWNGTVLPVFTELDPASVRQAANIVLGPVGTDDEGAPIEFTSRKRKLNAIAQDILTAYPDREEANLLAGLVSANEVNGINELMSQHFTGKPDINFRSPKQMQRLFYQTLGMQVRVVNKLTDKQREDEEFRKAFYARRDYIEGKLGREPTDLEREVWMSKASTDDDAVEYALFRDDLSDEIKEVLNAYLTIKTMQTRISLFYNTYAVIPHWKDGRVHPSMNQCQAATRRYSSSEPNMQQLPSRGDGVKFRKILVAPKGYVYVSLDHSGQELRLMAELSGDENMLSCYIGDNLRDIHSLVAVRAAPFIWGREISYETYMAARKSEDEETAKEAKDLRDDSKTTNFATQYGAQALKVSIQLKTSEETAQQFIDAKDATFPGIGLWKDKVEAEAEATGLAFTMLGVPRHLRSSVLSPNSWVRSKAERQASNFWIQGSGAEMVKLVLSRLWREGVFTGHYRAQFVGPVHDEVVFMVHVDDAVPVIRAAHEAMTQKYATMSVPIVSELAIGLDFSAPVEVGGEFTDHDVGSAVRALLAPAEKIATESLQDEPALTAG